MTKKDSQNTKSVQFAASAQKAVQWLYALVSYAEKRVGRTICPDIEEILNLCQKADCSLQELERYRAGQSGPPALALFGGDSLLAERMAGVLSLPLTFTETKATNIVWDARIGPRENWAIRYRNSQRQISALALETFLKTGVAAGDIVTIHRTIQGETPSKWKFIWVPMPTELESYWDTPEGVGILAAQHASVIILEDTPQMLVEELRKLGQRRWEQRREDFQDSDALARLESEVSTLLNTNPAEQTIRAEGTWRWLRERCQASLEHQKKEVKKVLKLQQERLTRVEQLLAEYRRSWLRGFHNEVEAHIRLQLKSPPMGKLLGGKTKLTPNAFLKSMAFNTMKTKLEDFVVERLAEFIAGLGALAVKLGLPKLSLAEDHISWTTNNLVAKFETVLTEKKIFPTTKERRRLATPITGRSASAQEERKRQIEEACRVISVTVEMSWAQWCTEFFTNSRKHIEQIINTALVADGQFSIIQLQEKIDGIDAIITALYGEKASVTARANALVIRQLEDFARQEWFRPV